jgi:beta-lactamase regulating signal transducer with metallopeptidase domain
MLAQLSSFADRWLELFGYVILQNTLFLGVIFLVLYLLRDKNAQVKYAVAALGIIKLLVPPFIPFTLRQSVAVSAQTVGTFEVGEISVASGLNPVSTGSPISFISILFLIWTLTALIMIGSSLISTLRLQWHLRGSTFVKKATIDGIKVDIFCSSNISVPLSIGLRPKQVFVPLLWSSLTDDLQHSLLRHEVAHIKRWDGLTHAMQMLVNALYFFHPLVWILSERMNEYREMACDDMAVEDSEVSPIVYSRCLVHVAEHMLPSWSCSSASTLIKQRNKRWAQQR